MSEIESGQAVPESQTALGPAPGFSGLGLSAPILRALDLVGYETPSPIQEKIIPHVMAGRDVLGQAQTGTGKTAAFALPLLSKIDINRYEPQVMVLVPTRELAIQVSEAFQRYASQLKGFHVLPIYGGQDYKGQLRMLARGVHVVVGTPGRLMDHLKRGTLKLEGLNSIVIDEADEMLRMGFIDDVTWILEQTPEGRQVALFSATMPDPIRRIAQRHLHSPEEVTIKVTTSSAELIHQRFWLVSGISKLEALTRILESEDFDGMIVFVRTKTSTTELAEKLEARGFSTAPLNGDLSQNQRERTIERLKNGEIDILVATDVAARGLDVERVSHVINFDIPYDTEAYIHRIGRTGRAGRSGEAILFLSPREKRMLFSIERATKQRLDQVRLPTPEAIQDKRMERFKQRIADALTQDGLTPYQMMVEQVMADKGASALDVAAALAKQLQGNNPSLKPSRTRPEGGFEAKRELHREVSRGEDLRFARVAEPRELKLVDAGPKRQPASEARPERRERMEKEEFSERPPRHERPERSGMAERFESYERDNAADEDRPRKTKRGDSPWSDENAWSDEGRSRRSERAHQPEPGMETYRIEIGREHGVQPGNIVGAITNEVGIEKRYIGRIQLYEEYSTVDLPEGLHPSLLKLMKKLWVVGRPMNISLLDATKAKAPRRAEADDRPKRRDDWEERPVRRDERAEAPKRREDWDEKPKRAKKSVSPFPKKRK